MVGTTVLVFKTPFILNKAPKHGDIDAGHLDVPKRNPLSEKKKFPT